MPKSPAQGYAKLGQVDDDELAGDPAWALPKSCRGIYI
jgi:hypothetical protein